MPPCSTTENRTRLRRARGSSSAAPSRCASRGSTSRPPSANEPVLVVRGADGVLRAMIERLPPPRRSRSPEGRESVRSCSAAITAGRTRSTDASRYAGVRRRRRISIAPRACCRNISVEIWNELVFVNLDPRAESLDRFPRRAARRHAAARLHRLPARAAKDVGARLQLEGLRRQLPRGLPHPDRPSRACSASSTTRTTARRRSAATRSSSRRRARMPERIRTQRRRRSGPLLLDLPEPDAERLSRQLLDEPHPPAGPGRTRHALRLVLQGSRRRRKPQIDETVAFSDEIQLEDIDICEAVQRGLRSSTYDRGRFSPQRENGVHHFHCLYEEMMGGA